MLVALFWAIATAIAAATIGFAHRGYRLVPMGSPHTLTPQELACVAGGAQLALDAALAGLHRSGMIDVTNGTLAAVGSSAPSGTALDRAIYHVASTQRPPPQALPAEPAVARALAEIRARLDRTGLMKGARVRRTYWLGLGVLQTLCGMGVVQLVFGIANGTPAGYLGLSLAIVEAASLC